MADWVSVRASDLTEREPPRGGRGHSFRSPKHIPWLRYCGGCGHMPLRNGISQLVTRIGCDYERDARYLAWLSGGRKPLEVAHV